MIDIIEKHTIIIHFWHLILILIIGFSIKAITPFINKWLSNHLLSKNYLRISHFPKESIHHYDYKFGFRIVKIDKLSNLRLALNKIDDINIPDDYKVPYTRIFLLKLEYANVFFVIKLFAILLTLSVLYKLSFIPKNELIIKLPENLLTQLANQFDVDTDNLLKIDNFFKHEYEPGRKNT